MKINYKLKRFLKRNAKRLIRYFIYFHLISLLSFNSFALSPYEYKDFSSFVGDGLVTCFLGLNVEPFEPLRYVEYFSTANGDNLNDITVAYEEEPTPGLYPYTDFAFSITNSSNVNVKFNPNDVISMSQTIVLDMHDSFAVNTYDDFFRIIINYESADGLEESFVLSGDDVLSSSDVINYTDYSRIIYNVQFSKVLPSVSGNIVSIRYEMYNITFNSYSLRVYGSKNVSTNSDINPLTYYVGSASNAPIYQTPDDSAVNDYHDKEQGLLDDTDASSETNNIFKEFSTGLGRVTAGLMVIKSFLEPFLTFQWLKAILYVSLALGIFSFMVNIGVSSIGRTVVRSQSKYAQSERDRAKRGGLN